MSIETTAEAYPLPSVERLDKLIGDLEYAVLARVQGLPESVAKLSDAKAAIRSYAERLAVPQWQPIETAPKDGTEVLLYAPPCEHEGKPVPQRTTYGYWLKPSDIPRIKYQDGFAPEEEWDEFEPFWMSWDGGFTDEHPPTHWMPMPAAPIDAAMKEQK